MHYIVVAQYKGHACFVLLVHKTPFAALLMANTALPYTESSLAVLNHVNQLCMPVCCQSSQLKC